MKVDIVNQKYQTGQFNTHSGAKKTNFTGTASYAEQITQGLYHAKTINLMKKLEWLKGEIGGILITAVGTGAVAPIFIGFNPFVRPPKDATPEQREENFNTKKYTAMRQPISAALAILFQASVQKYIDKVLDLFVNSPKNASAWRTDIDQSHLNTDTFIKGKVRKQMKSEGIKKPSMLYYFFGPKEEYNGKMVRKRTKYDIMFNERVQKIKDSQIEQLANTFQETKQIPLSKGHFDNKTVAELVNSQIDAYKQDAEMLKKTDVEIAQKVQRAKILVENENYLEEIFKNIPVKEIRETEDPQELKQLYKKTEDIIKVLIEKEKNADIKAILQEILERPEDLRAHRVGRTLWRIDNIKNMCGNKGFSTQNYLDAMIERNNVLEKIKVKLNAAKIENTAAATEESITKTINKIIELCQFKEDGGIMESVLRDTDTFQPSKEGEKLTKKVYKDIIKGYKKLIDNSYKSWNQFTKIGVGVFITLPITCTALNWVYPRFMEIFFPKLAGVKKAQQNPQKAGGDK